MWNHDWKATNLVSHSLPTIAAMPAPGFVT
jgi:hypothetical protein